MTAQISPPELRPGQQSPPILVVGMHRSGTSLVARLLHAMGVEVGAPEALLPADASNPAGYWEHTDAVRVDIEVVNELRASRHDVAGIDIERLSDARRAEVVARMRQVAASLCERRRPFLIKDPRISLLFPLWRQALGEPVCVIPWREPAAAAKSIAVRDRRPYAISLALWEHYNCTLLRDTSGCRRILVSYEALLNDPASVVRALHDRLRGLGIQPLAMPADQQLRSIVDPALNRSGIDVVAERAAVTPAQRELAHALQTGAALSDPAPQTSPASLELLAAFSTLEVKGAALQRHASHLDALLAAVFQSRSWRIGHAVTALAWMFARRPRATAYDRWRDIRGTPPC